MSESETKSQSVKVDFNNQSTKFFGPVPTAPKHEPPPPPGEADADERRRIAAGSVTDSQLRLLEADAGEAGRELPDEPGFWVRDGVMYMVSMTDSHGRGELYATTLKANGYPQVCKREAVRGHWFKATLADDERRELERMIPDSFYAGTHLTHRVHMLVEDWRSALRATHKLQDENAALQAKLAEAERERDELRLDRDSLLMQAAERTEG